MLSLVLIAVIAVTMSAGYPSGPPVHLTEWNNTAINICQDMYPHGHGYAKQTSTPPFAISVTQNCITKNQKVLVTISSNSEAEYFEGLFVQARSSAGGAIEDVQSIGAFTSGDADLSPLKCFNNAKGAIGHNKKAHYTEKKFEWTAPDSINSNIKFVATMVHETEKFWLWVQSSEMMYNSACQAESYDDPWPASGVSRVGVSMMLVIFAIFSMPILADM